MPEDEPPRGSGGFETVQFGSSGGRGPQRWVLAVGVVLAVAVAGLVIKQFVGSDASSPPGPVGSSASTEGSGPADDGGAVQPTPVPPPADQPKASGIDVSWLHAKSDWTLFVRTDESVLGVQPRSGRVVTTTVPALQSSGPVSFVVRRGEVLIRPLDVVPGYLVRDGQAAHRSGLPRGGLIYPGPAQDQLWIFNGHRRVDLVRLDGSRIGPTIRMPAGVIDPFPRSDGSGHLLLTGVGGTYLARADGLHRVTTGAVVATGPRSLVMIECNNRARCHPSVYDKRTGNKRSVPTELPPVEAIADGVTSPDGNRMAFASGTDETPIVTVVDLRTGHQHVVAARINRGAPDGQAIAWSPDNRWVFIASLDGMIQVANGSTGEVRTVDLGLPDVQQVAIRP